MPRGRNSAHHRGLVGHGAAHLLGAEQLAEDLIALLLEMVGDAVTVGILEGLLAALRTGHQPCQL
jgi:hypothetical protein